MKIRFKKYAPLLIISVIFLAFIPYNYFSHDKIVDVGIHTAYYADLDGDGLEDDIRIILNLTLIGFSEANFKQGVEYGMLLNLIMPSNTKYTYTYTDVENTTKFALQADIFNQATEQGLYTIRVAGYYKNLDNNKPFIEAFHQFDPPGGQTGDDPRFMITRL